jgi:hypothetical protein
MWIRSFNFTGSGNNQITDTEMLFANCLRRNIPLIMCACIPRIEQQPKENSGTFEAVTSSCCFCRRKYHRKQRTDFEVKWIPDTTKSSPWEISWFLMAVAMKFTVAWDVTHCILVDRYQCFVRTCCQTTRCLIPEKNNFQDLPNFVSVNYLILYSNIHKSYKPMRNRFLLCSSLINYAQQQNTSELPRNVDCLGVN